MLLLQSLGTKVLLVLRKVRHMKKEVMKAKMKTYRKPAKAKDNYVGIEIEFSSPFPEDQVMDMLIEHKLNKYIQIGYDGHPPVGHVGYEWKVLVKEKELKKVLDALSKVIGLIGGISNDSCGLHVHLDMRHRNAEKVYNNLVRAQKILYGVADQRRTTSRWCMPSNTPELIKATRGKNSGINPHLSATKNTIEVRIREGIVDTNDMYNWVCLLTSIADNEMLNEEVNKVSDLQRVTALNEAIREYVSTRVRANARTDLLEAA